ncbi:MAG: ABC transporter ATP-binding protein [Anaerolineae bacterium]|nr:ABC transporter ATP-binding protein [Anaerolineae bacterium]
MAARWARIRARVDRIGQRVRTRFTYDPTWQFVGNIGDLIWEFKWYSLSIFAVTILQEIAALWPVNLLGDFIDGLESGEVGHIVWLLLGASLFYPGLLRANVILRHKMFYETDLSKRVELILHASDAGRWTDSEAAGAAYTKTVNAVSGITNAVYHILASFTPVVIKIVIVSGNLLTYNRLLGIAYVTSLVFPLAMTFLFNNRLRVLRDSQYAMIGESSGLGIKVIAEKENQDVRQKFRDVMRTRTDVFVSLLAKSQSFLYVREAALIGSQFLVVLMALSMRQRLNMTPGDFTKIVGYTTQVAAAFISAASCLDAIVSYSRAYYIYAAAYNVGAGEGSDTQA